MWVSALRQLLTVCGGHILNQITMKISRVFLVESWVRVGVNPADFPEICKVGVDPAELPEICTVGVDPAELPVICTVGVDPAELPEICTVGVDPAELPVICTVGVDPAELPEICSASNCPEIIQNRTTYDIGIGKILFIVM